MEDIVALATPPLKGALSIIRLSGDNVFKIISKISNKDITKVDKRTLKIANILDENNKLVDEVVLAIYKGPKSFTGEDLVEVICHGSMVIANQIISLILNNGARYALNGEFSSRAFLNNKIDLIQAEAINDAINSTSVEAKNLSLLSLKGETSTLVKEIKTRIADILSLIEVNIDYPEYEDIEVANKELIINTCNEITNKVENLIKSSKKAALVKSGVTITIVGKPNVGKSSLLNALIKQDKAIVSDIAGTTRDVVEADILFNGVTLHFKDTAGIRESNDKIESIGVNKSIDALKDADIVLMVLDSTKDIDDEDKEIIKMVKDKNTIYVYNKMDTLSSLKDKDKIYVSALNNDVEPLLKEITKNIGIDESVFKTPSLNNEREIGLLNKCLNALMLAKEDALKDSPIDLVAINLKEAFDSILEILGEVKQDAIYKEIFSRFCVGK